MSDSRVIAPLGQELVTKRPQFEAALTGTGISPAKFIRTVMTAVNMDPYLVNANRASLMNAALKCATDGLLPDGRDAALVPFDGHVTYMPMVAGIRKKVRRTGEITLWDVREVHAKDSFGYELGDEPFIHHKPWLPKPIEKGAEENEADYAARLRRHVDPGPVTHVYSIAKLKGGDVSRDVMTRLEVEIVRDTYARKNRKGEFSPAWRKSFGQMACKTVVRRHSKVLPMSSDLEALIHRDDNQYELDRPPNERIEAPKDLSDRLDFLTTYEPEPSREETPDPELESGQAGEVAPDPLPEASPPTAAAVLPDAAAVGPDAAASPDQPKPKKPESKKPETPQQALKRIEEQGDSIAKVHGYAAVEMWINSELSPDETALIGITMDRRWRELGKAK
jgi:recombination protein RecT